MLSNATSTTPASLARLMTGLNAEGFWALTTIASKPESMKLLMAAICAATSSPVETTLNSLSWAAMSGCAAKALAVWIIWMRQVLAMKPLASAMRKGPFLAGHLKNLVLSVHGAKQPGSEAGPATTWGPAAKAGAEKAHAAVNIAPTTTAAEKWRN